MVHPSSCFTQPLPITASNWATELIQTRMFVPIGWLTPIRGYMLFYVVSPQSGRCFVEQVIMWRGNLTYHQLLGPSVNYYSSCLVTHEYIARISWTFMQFFVSKALTAFILILQSVNSIIRALNGNCFLTALHLSYFISLLLRFETSTLTWLLVHSTMWLLHMTPTRSFMLARLIIPLIRIITAVCFITLWLIWRCVLVWSFLIHWLHPSHAPLQFRSAVYSFLVLQSRFARKFLSFASGCSYHPQCIQCIV